MSTYFLGFDIGGTFTDFVLLDENSGQTWVHKCLTTPENPAEGAMEGMAALLKERGLSMADLAMAIHGTTLVTNALLERTGASTALLTTKGFRDILQMGKEQRYDIYDLFLKFPEPLVPRRWRRGVHERLDRNGEVITSLDMDELRREITSLGEQGVESIAVSFLHAYVNPMHEQAVASLIEQEFPSMSLSLSSEVVAEIREYERTVTTVANAYVKPLVYRYVDSLKRRLAAGRFKGKLFFMKSAGGTATPQVAQEFPIQLLESGPAGGALAAAFYGDQLGRKNLISFDMGGTTAKACLIDEGVPIVTMVQEAARVHLFKKGSGIPIKSPAIDLIEIGAGGGSIANISNLGLMKVGPESAGAVPGPASYGLGGTSPTVTDANLVLGYLDPEYFLGGKMKLDVGASKKALEKIAKPLKMNEVETAWGIFSIVNENMAAATRIHIIERGRDPRRYSLVAFGGAGPAHACRVARILNAPEVTMPITAGNTSALGFLIAPISFDLSRSFPIVLDDLNWDELNQIYKELEERGTTQLVEAGVDPNKIAVSRTADMRMEGQFHEISVPLQNGAFGPDKLESMKEAFVDEYRRLYSHIFEGNPIMALTWRVRLAGPKPKISLAKNEAANSGGKGGGRQALKGIRKAYFPEVGDFSDVNVYDRYLLQSNDRIPGPAIFEERESTAVISPGDAANVDDYLNLVVSIANGDRTL